MSSNEKIYPIILAGGSGSRLWPLSRNSKPKQFIDLIGRESLFQKTVKRLNNDLFEKSIVVTNNQSRFMVQEQLSECSSLVSKIIIEPSPKNTAPASLVGIVHSENLSNNPYIIISPSDHLIDSEKLFYELITYAKKNLSDDKLLLIGCKPSHPHTGYGWINANITKNKSLYEIKNFIEKPNLELATKLFKSNSTFWNTGIFFGRSSVFMKEFENYQPDILNNVKLSYQHSTSDLNFLRLEKRFWNKLTSIPIDIAIMEKSKKTNVIPFKGNWTDLGSWKSIMEHLDKDNKDNVSYGNVTNIDSKDSFLYSANDKVHLVGIGLKNIISIATEDAVLVVDKDKTEEVKETINILKEKKIEQAVSFKYDFRPWGIFEILSKGKNFLVKKIIVFPKKRLSLQSHKFRSEHWVVVEGVAKVILNHETFNLGENESTYVNAGVVHRLENETDKNLIIVEVQTGSYLGEDDIIRIEDDFKR